MTKEVYDGSDNQPEFHCLHVISTARTMRSDFTQLFTGLTSQNLISLSVKKSGRSLKKHEET